MRISDWSSDVCSSDLQISDQAGQTASATAAADAATHASAQRAARVQVAMAKTRTSEAATLSCAIAHQVHGAMGFTHEHSLHLSSRRLLAWRDEFGSDSYWANWLGTAIPRITGASLWQGKGRRTGRERGGHVG